MTRNEFIAETAGRSINNYELPPEGHVGRAIAIADALESRGIAPWQTPPAPALTDAARRVVEAAVAYVDRYVDSMVGEHEQPLVSAVRAYKESVK